MRQHLSSREIWSAPLLLALLSCVGLISALVSDAGGDWLAWICLGLPVLVSVFYWLRR